MIPVSALTSHLYCPKKFYMNYVLGIKEPMKKPTIEGTIIHRAADLMQTGINNVTAMTKQNTSLQDLEMGYKKAYYLALFNSINSNEKYLEALGIDKKELFKTLWQQISEEAKIKAELVFNMISTYKIYGTDLLEKISANTEVMLTSETLGIRGIADRIEDKDGKTTIYEMKTGKAPSEGIWENHRIQLAAYMMILKETSQKEIGGIVEYGKEKRKLTLNPFIEDEVKELIITVRKIIETRTLPDDEVSQKKCDACGLKENCEKLNHQ